MGFPPWSQTGGLLHPNALSHTSQVSLPGQRLGSHMSIWDPFLWCNRTWHIFFTLPYWILLDCGWLGLGCHLIFLITTMIQFAPTYCLPPSGLASLPNHDTKSLFLRSSTLSGWSGLNDIWSNLTNLLDELEHSHFIVTPKRRQFLIRWILMAAQLQGNLKTVSVQVRPVLGTT